MDPWTFVFVADIHIGSPKSYRFQPAHNENWQTARRQILDINPDFLLLQGDLTRDGTLHKYELEAVKADLDNLPLRYHLLPGNQETGNKQTDVSGPIDEIDKWHPVPGASHDSDVNLNIRSEHLDQFSSVFGPHWFWWSFVHKGVRFSGMCDMIAGSGLPEEKEFWKWMESQREQPRAKHHVWITHYPLFINDLHEPNFDIRDPEQYLNWYYGIDEPARSRIMDVFKATGTDLVISGHVHCRKVHYAEGVRFDIAPSTAFGFCLDQWKDGDPALGFLRYDVTEQGIESTFVPLERISTAKGYGIRGHPPPDERDYSIAWEK
jgi:predicted MPP superfamily phosphohydrolase